MSDLPSAGGRKTGDTVLGLEAVNGPANGQIVVEAKDERLSQAKAVKELDRAMAERDADYAILRVASEDRVPVGCLSLQELAGNKLVVALSGSDIDEDIVRLAYRYARVRTRMLRSADARLDASGVREAAQSAALALAGVRAIASALTGATRQIEAARTGLTEMVASVSAHLTRIEALVGPRSQDQAEAG